MRRINSLFLLSCICWMGCAKTVINDTIVPVGGVNNPGSSIRLFNIFSYPMDVTVNNIPLTSYGLDAGVGPGVSLFPSGVWNPGSSFTIPSGLLDKNGNAAISLSPRGFPLTNDTLPKPKDTVLPNNPLAPVDYYILSDGHYHGIRRSITAAPDPRSARIRIINLGAAVDGNGLAGPVTLTYADGTAVDPRLSNIARDQTSDYVDIPYGAYEFKLFVNGNFTKQMTQGVPPNSINDFFNGGFHYIQDQEARFPPVTLFKPGGFYTFFISQNLYVYKDTYASPVYIFANGYNLFTENSPPVNTTYARLQVVNTLPAAGAINASVDGVQLESLLGYTAHSDYLTVVKGTHTVGVTDGAGKLLVSKDIMLYPYDNISAWVYMKNGVPDICFAANDMSNMGTNLRFNCLNLCDGIPYLTFTNDVSLFEGADSATENLALGRAAEILPYANFDKGLMQGYNSPIEPGGPVSMTMRAFQSSPGPPVVLPGSYLDQIKALTTEPFVANPSMYTGAQYIPNQPEPGAYTVALIGKKDAPSGDPLAPKIIVLKHTK